MSDIQALMRSANPIEDAHTEFGREDLDALLLLTQHRSMDMDAKQLTRPPEPDRRSRRGWLVAAATFTSVIVVVALAMWMTRSTDEAPPATSPTTTVDAAPETTTPPTTTEVTSTTIAPTDESAISFAEALVAAVNDGDADGVRQVFDQAASVVSSDTADEDDSARETGRFTAWALLDSTAEIVGCAPLSSGPTRCEITRTSPFDASSENSQGLVLLITTGPAGDVDRLRIDFGAGSWLAVESAFGEWVRDTEPDAFVPMFVDFSDAERTAELWRDLYPVWSDATS
jgi:hypothetical protein